MVTKGCYLGPRPLLYSCDQPVDFVLIVGRWLLHLQKEEEGRAKGKGQRETLAEFVPLGFRETTNVLEASQIIFSLYSICQN